MSRSYDPALTKHLIPGGGGKWSPRASAMALLLREEEAAAAAAEAAAAAAGGGGGGASVAGPMSVASSAALVPAPQFRTLIQHQSRSAIVSARRSVSAARFMPGTGGRGSITMSGSFVGGVGDDSVLTDDDGAARTFRSTDGVGLAVGEVPPGSGARGRSLSAARSVASLAPSTTLLGRSPSFMQPTSTSLAREAVTAEHETSRMAALVRPEACGESERQRGHTTSPPPPPPLQAADVAALPLVHPPPIPATPGQSVGERSRSRTRRISAALSGLSPMPSFVLGNGTVVSGLEDEDAGGSPGGRLRSVSFTAPTQVR